MKVKSEEYADIIHKDLLEWLKHLPKHNSNLKQELRITDNSFELKLLEGTEHSKENLSIKKK